VDKRSVWSLSRVVQEGSRERRQTVRCNIKEFDAPAARSSKVARFSGYDVLYIRFPNAKNIILTEFCGR
jgi:hypothetical protein